MKELSGNNKLRFSDWFDRTAIFIFLGFIFSVLVLGRFFSLIHFGNIYITELILGILILAIIPRLKYIFKLPLGFLIPAGIYFVFGLGQFLLSLGENNKYVFHDSVFFTYVLFIPIVYIFFSKKPRLKSFLSIIVISNILSLIIIRLCVYQELTPEGLLNIFFGKVKAFNYGLYYGISLAFLVPFYRIVKNKIYKILILFMCSGNLYIIFIWGIRTAWLAYLVLLVFFALAMKIRIIKFSSGLAAVFIITFIISTGVFKLDSEHLKTEILPGKLNSVGFFFKDKVKENAIIPPLIKETKDDDKNSGAAHKPITKQKETKNVKIYTTTSGKRITNMGANFLEFKENTKFTDKDIASKTVIEEAKKFEAGLSSIIWRLGVWKRLILFGLESPVFGKGFGRNPIKRTPITKGYILNVTPAHNHIISVFYRMGLFGLVLFLFINIYSFLYGLSYLTKAKDEFLRCILMGGVGSFIVWHVMALFFDVINSPPTGIFLWIIIGLIFAVVEVDKKIIVDKTQKR